MCRCRCPDTLSLAQTTHSCFKSTLDRHSSIPEAITTTHRSWPSQSTNTPLAESPSHQRHTPAAQIPIAERAAHRGPTDVPNAHLTGFVATAPEAAAKRFEILKEIRALSQGRDLERMLPGLTITSSARESSIGSDQSIRGNERFRGRYLI